MLACWQLNAEHWSRPCDATPRDQALLTAIAFRFSPAVTAPARTSKSSQLVFIRSMSLNGSNIGAERIGCRPQKLRRAQASQQPLRRDGSEMRIRCLFDLESQKLTRPEFDLVHLPRLALLILDS
jgi:hypothetical protein